MLDAEGRFSLEELPDVTIYPDSRSDTRFYPVPDRPSIASDESGKPQISLLIYGHKTGAALQVQGGQLMLTTSLSLTEHELEKLRQGLTRRLAQAAAHEHQEATSDGDTRNADAAGRRSPARKGENRDRAQNPPTPPPTPEISSPNWSKGTVEVRIGELVLEGNPSLIGTNQCALMLSLDAAQAGKLEKSWRDGLPGATISYSLRTTAATSRSAEDTVRSDAEAHSPSRDFYTTYNLNVLTTSEEAQELPLRIEGPLRLSKDELKNKMQVLNL